MTKEVDFLSLNKSEANTKGTKTSTNTKKEGTSLFDSLVEKSQKEVNTKKEESTKENNNTKSDVLKDTKNTKSENINDQVTKTVKSDTKENTTLSEKKSENNNNIEQAKDNKDFKNDTTEVEKNNKETNNSRATSLLDRMILESKKNVKIASDTKVDDTILKNKDKILPSNTNSESQKSSTNNSKTSLLDKMIEQAKTDISSEKKESKTIIKDSKEANKVELKNNVKSLKEETASPSTKQDIKSDKNLEKEDIKLKNINESTKSAKENSIKNIDENEKEVKKDSKLDNTDNSKKVEVLKEQIQTNKEELQTTIKDVVVDKEKVDNSNKVTDSTKKVDVLKEQIQTNKEELQVAVKQTVVSKEKELNETPKNTEKIINKDESSSKLDINKSETKVTDNVKTIDNIQTKIESKKEDNITQNKPVTKETAKFDEKTKVDSEQRVNVSKDDLEKSISKKESTETKSLMDRLLDNANKSTISSKSTQIDSDLMNIKTTKQKGNDVVTNIFLGSQKNSIYNQMLSNKSEGVKLAKEATSVEDIKKSAKKLDLGLKDTSIEIVNSDTSTKKSNENSKELYLDKLAFERNIKDDKEIDKKVINQKMSSLSASASNAVIQSSVSAIEESVVNINVNPSLAMSIQSRIIGAQQQMSSMMSDVARNMYQNYKPPVTAFRINLFPSQLGHIAILMKNDKENSISISLNMSNSNTLDSFVENQGVLRDALNRNFNNNQTTFNLDFNMQDGNFDNQSSKDQNKEEQSKQNISSNDIIESINENQNVGEDLNYL